MINIQSLNEMYAHMKKQPLLTSDDYILLGNVSYGSETSERILTQVAVLVKGQQQMKNIIDKLTLLHSELKRFSECVGPVTRRSEDYHTDDVDNIIENPHENLHAISICSSIVGNLLPTRDHYVELTEVLNEIGDEGVLDGYNRFFEHLSAMLTLRRPFNEILELFD
ncbi:hypothetical protein [Dyadobacter sp. CY312]|uniref:hypothetical protein n=1 Tax=Dyadobacter sp. CY312 TaxID=2907303 RepID=UPI001F26895C|nr:hypothetical protein [Dyadobacter sp. CY312]MCE7038978.1 hypothetical protein [Dyadobacter sp. CY312]